MLYSAWHAAARRLSTLTASLASLSRSASAPTTDFRQSSGRHVHVFWNCYQRLTSEITRRDKIRNKEIRHRTGLETLSHTEVDQTAANVHRMVTIESPKQALTWVPENGKNGRPRNLESPGVTLSEDLQYIDMTWDDFGEVTDDRPSWKSYVTQWLVQCNSETAVGYLFIHSFIHSFIYYVNRTKIHEKCK